MFEKYRNSDVVYIIAEVGQNHQGSIEIAKQYIETFAKLGANAVKFQMRDNEYLFSNAAFDRPYDNENSFGETYGEHRNFLEFNMEGWHQIRACCKSVGVDFMCTPFDEPSLDRLLELNVDLLKVASFDLANIPFLTKIAKTRKPVVISVGGGKLNHIESSVELFQSENVDFALLHCVSEYPCPIEKLGLNNIKSLIEKYPEMTVGLSDHFNGILSGPIGYMNGARVFEKHVTFNRANKGTDHSFALEPKGFENFVRDIKRTPIMNRAADISSLGEEKVFKKLGKSICASENISMGEIFSEQNIRGLIDVEQGIPVRESVYLIGKKSKREYKEGELVEQSELFE